MGYEECLGYIYGLYNYMVGVKYISYLTPTMSDNIILIRIKTRVITNINIAIFRFIHKSFSSKKNRKLGGKKCKIKSEKTNLYPIK